MNNMNGVLNSVKDVTLREIDFASRLVSGCNPPGWTALEHDLYRFSAPRVDAFWEGESL